MLEHSFRRDVDDFDDCFKKSIKIGKILQFFLSRIRGRKLIFTLGCLFRRGRKRTLSIERDGNLWVKGDSE